MNIFREIEKRLFPETLECVYRKDILEYALKHHKYPNSDNYGGLCKALINALNHYGISTRGVNIDYYLPLFRNHIAGTQFNAKINYLGDTGEFWWPKGNWNMGRLDFLKWLLEQYKDDKTNLKEL